MANVYKNANYKLATTAVTDIYTCPNNSRAIVKKIHAANTGAGNDSIKAFIYDSSDSVTYQFAEHTVNVNNSQAVGDGTFILEENDKLQLQAATSNHFEGKQESKKIYEKQIDGRTIPVITPEVILTITHKETGREYLSEKEVEDDINSPHTSTTKDHIKRDVEIKIAEMPPLGGSSEM
jgi:hypothetical protein